ncbi:MAG: hypothetical protein ACPGWR_31960 [Ardenticatenaceae bacterium]
MAAIYGRALPSATVDELLRSRTRIVSLFGADKHAYGDKHTNPHSLADADAETDLHATPCTFTFQRQ